MTQRPTSAPALPSALARLADFGSELVAVKLGLMEVIAWLAQSRGIGRYNGFQMPAAHGAHNGRRAYTQVLGCFLNVHDRVLVSLLRLVNAISHIGNYTRFSRLFEYCFGLIIHAIMR
jgi:hypothetical protein